MPHEEKICECQQWPYGTVQYGGDFHGYGMLTATILRHDGAIELDRTVEVWDDGDTEYFGLHTFKQLMDASSDDQA